MELHAQIEAVLFWNGGGESIVNLAKILGTSEKNVLEGLDTLEKELSSRGVRLMRNKDEVMLGTAPEMSSVIQKLIREELERDLGKAGLETLTVILYLGPVTRSTIDYIRGVNSSYILRHLSVRGLVERSINPNDQRSYIYTPTFALLGHLGLSRIEDLPEYDTVKAELTTFLSHENDNARE